MPVVEGQARTTSQEPAPQARARTAQRAQTRPATTEPLGSCGREGGKGPSTAFVHTFCLSQYPYGTPSLFSLSQR